MSEAKKAGVPTPLIFQVDVKNATIIMELIEGIQVKRVLRDFSPERRRTLCSRIGELIGKLHQTGIIHGDLTTSNMILTDASKVFFVDFGLGEKNVELEAKGVDLHLFKRALQSTHFQFAEECFSAATKGYVAVLGESEAKDVLEKVKEIERRGRYVAERRESEFSA
jgi:TP53 regulating kinase-like protein